MTNKKNAVVSGPHHRTRERLVGAQLSNRCQDYTSEETESDK